MQHELQGVAYELQAGASTAIDTYNRDEQRCCTRTEHRFDCMPQNRNEYC